MKLKIMFQNYSSSTTDKGKKEGKASFEIKPPNIDTIPFDVIREPIISYLNHRDLTSLSMANKSLMESLDKNPIKRKYEIKDNIWKEYINVLKQKIYDNEELTKDDIIMINQIDEIPDDFNVKLSLDDASFLKHFINVRKIGNNFLSNCTNLMYVNLKELTKLEVIGDNFLSDCSNLLEVVLPEPKDNKIQIIGNNFLYNCINLLNIDLSNLVSLRRVGENFLYKCDRLVRKKLPLRTSIIPKRSESKKTDITSEKLDFLRRLR